MSPYPANLKKKSCVGVLCNQTIYKLCDKIKSRGGQGLRQASAMLDQSHYVNELMCAVGGVLVFVAKSEWRGGEQKKLEKLEFDMPTN